MYLKYYNFNLIQIIAWKIYYISENIIKDVHEDDIRKELYHLDKGIISCYFDKTNWILEKKWEKLW